MLKLQKMELVGFKSFMDKTEVSFPDGITAVVGPNGCGKSNIGDAISWVLGEQSVKMLRGLKMEDVIFNGSESKKPLGMAEVSLRFLSQNGSDGNGSEEIILTRRLFRSGESEYVLNGERCRLKDIRNLLSQVHIGAKTCAVIEQGRVEEIMNAKPAERRLLIEEAAGILGYKGKRKLAETKLEATKANLLRVQDIIAEVERQMNSLRRQASKARRFKRLNETKRQKQAQLFIMRHSRLASELEQLDSHLDALKVKEAQLLGQLGVLEATFERNKQDVSEKEDALSVGVEKGHLLDKEMGLLEASIRSSEEKQGELESALERAAQEKQAIDTRLETLEENIIEKVRERVVYEAEKAETGEKIRERELSLKELKEKESDLQRALEEKRENLITEAQLLAEMKNRLVMNESECLKIESALAKKSNEEAEEHVRIEQMRDDLSHMKERVVLKEKERSEHSEVLDTIGKKKESCEENLRVIEGTLAERTVELNSLKEKEKIYSQPEVTHEGIGNGAQAILHEGEKYTIRHSGIVADWIKPGSEYEKAIEGYMSELLASLVVESLDDALQAMRGLKAANAGSARFLFRPKQKREETICEIPIEVKENNSFIGKLSEKIEFTDGVKDILGGMLKRCVIVRDVESARLFCERHPELDYVTLDGEVFRSGCFASIGHCGNEGHGLLHRRGELGSIRKEIEKIDAEIINLRGDAEKESEKRKGMREEEELVQEKRRSVEGELFAMQHETRHLSEMISRSEKQSALLRDEMQLSENDRTMIADEIERLKNESSLKEREIEKMEASIGMLKSELETIRGAIALESGGFAEIYSEFSEKSQNIASLDADVAHLKENMEQVSKRREELIGNEREWRQAIERLREGIDGSRDTVGKLMLERKDLHDQNESLRRDIAAMKDATVSIEAEVKQVRHKIESLREEMKEKELSRTSVHSDIKHNSENCSEELGKSVSDLQSSVTLDPEMNEELLHQQITDLGGIIERVGPINMMAMEEYDSLEERFNFLSTQRKDLTGSMESLHETIRKINRTSREKFLRAFETIRLNFNETFSILFGGGKANLKLEEDIDILESGLEIIAQPPGKRLQNINLLSGGEKALTAIALLFAVFRYQPSPFCLLDEADAPLDDLNVGRYLNLLKEFSDRTQFILITHNKKTMEVANLLYGVTMEEPGISKVVSLKLN